MDQANPIIIFLMFLARCLVPLLIMLAIAYILKRLGMIKDLPIQPNGNGNGNGNGIGNVNNNHDHDRDEGELVHGKV